MLSGSDAYKQSKIPDPDWRDSHESDVCFIVFNLHSAFSWPVLDGISVSVSCSVEMSDLLDT